MYKIIGADGKEYGPVSLEQIRRWVTEGRVNARTRLQEPGAAEWKAAAELPDLADLFTPTVPGAMPASAPPLSAAGPEGRKGLAITSSIPAAV